MKRKLALLFFTLFILITLSAESNTKYEKCLLLSDASGMELDFFDRDYYLSQWYEFDNDTENFTLFLQQKDYSVDIYKGYYTISYNETNNSGFFTINLQKKYSGYTGDKTSVWKDNYKTVKVLFRAEGTLQLKENGMLTDGTCKYHFMYLEDGLSYDKYTLYDMDKVFAQTSKIFQTIECSASEMLLLIHTDSFGLFYIKERGGHFTYLPSYETEIIESNYSWY